LCNLNIDPLHCDQTAEWSLGLCFRHDLDLLWQHQAIPESQFTNQCRHVGKGIKRRLLCFSIRTRFGERLCAQHLVQNAE